MKITRVSYERLTLNLFEPYTIAYETISKTTNFILKIETEGLLVGYGCAAPDEIVTGETAEQVEIAIKDIVLPFLMGKDPFTYVQILMDLKGLLNFRSSTLAMVDMALHDLISRKASVPLYKYLGGFRPNIATSITIGILSIEETLVSATKFISGGFFILKIKGGIHLEEDVEKMIRLREKFPKVTLRFDGNQGYSVEQAVDFVKKTTTVGIEIFEQPTKEGYEAQLGEVTDRVHLPVMADESIKTLADVFRLAQNKSVDMVNIKLMKVGGILEGMHINSVAKSAGLETMVGCNDECALGIAAGLHFALSRPNIQYADLDGHFDIVNDPFKDLFLINKGVLYPTDNPGLGKITL